MKSIKGIKIILLYDAGSLGRAGSIVNVKPGYAKNYLIPRRLALYATKHNIDNFQKNREEITKKSSDRSVLAMSVQTILKGKLFTFICNASDDGRLYGSIPVKKIVAAANNEIARGGCADFLIDAHNVSIGSGIKFIGSHIAKIVIYDKIAVEVSIAACRSESDAAAIAAEYTATITTEADQQQDGQA